MAISEISNRKRLISRLIGVGWLFLIMACPFRGQAPAPTSAQNFAYVATMKFDVASVRENTTVNASDGFTMSGRFVPHTTTLRVFNWDIENLIGLAYGVDQYQIEKSPKWPFGTVFVIEAKGDTEADTRMAALTDDQQRAEQRHMLQALLEERFNLKTHWDSREGDIYKLVAAKGGPKLGAAGSMPPSADEAAVLGDGPIPPLRQVNDGQGYDFIAYKCSMNELVAVLTSQFGRPVMDETNLTGRYDFVLKYKGRWDRDRAADDTDTTPPLDRALQDELGLKVLAAKGPTRVLVIDHIDKPSEN